MLVRQCVFGPVCLGALGFTFLLAHFFNTSGGYIKSQKMVKKIKFTMTSPLSGKIKVLPAMFCIVIVWTNWLGLHR